MHRILLKSKIHRTRVTEANVDYEGSITIDTALMNAADIAPWEKVHIWNVTNGNRLETYAIPGKENSGVVCINGAAAHLVSKGDIIIIGTFAEVDEEKIENYEPKCIYVNEKNEILGI